LFNRHPLLLSLLALILGIISAGFYPIEKTHALWLAGAFLLLTAFVSLRKSTRNRFTFFMLFLLGGYTITLWQNQRFTDNHYARLASNGKHTYLAEALANPVPTKRAYRLELDLLAKETKEDISGKVYLYIPKDSAYAGILPGDKVLFTAALNTINAPLNPHEFDYQNYLHLHQIFRQGYTTQLKVLAAKENSVMRYTSMVRMKLLGYIHQLDLSDEEVAIASALLVGYRHLITDETTQNFAGAGAMHVLAVSGLHVGILYIITAFLLGINRKNPNQNAWPKVLLTVAIIWLYALVTGLSPSVTRASVMFTFIAFGNISGRKSSTIQAIIASALFMLLFKPNYLFEVGFQLSYAAVIGIVLLQPRIYNLFPRSKFKIINLGLQITAVSIAAQLSTFAFSLYYFHQFPAWFIVSNLFVIPLAYGLMCYGIFLLLVSIFIAPPALLVLPFKGLMWLMLSGIEWVNQLPGALITGLWVNRFELVCITFLAFAGAEMLFNKNKKAAFASLLGGIALMTSFILSGFEYRKDNGITIYSVPKQSVIEIHQDDKSYLIAPAAFLADESAVLFYAKHNIWAKGKHVKLLKIDINKDTLTPDFSLQNGILKTRNQQLLILDEPSDTNLFALKPNCILVTTNGINIPFRTKAKIIIQHGVRPKENAHILAEDGAYYISTE
jgi:competence protein ComEC